MTVANSITVVSHLRRELWANGYRAVAVHNWNAPGPSPGKRPDGMGWTTRARQVPPDAVEREAEPGTLNTGILCDGLRPLDIDFPDPAESTVLRDLAFEHFGRTIARTRGNSGKLLLLYRAAEGEPRKREIVASDRRKIEVLGHGGQFVAFGTHETGAAIEWRDGSPLSEHYDFLPGITEQQIDEYFAAVRQLHPSAAPSAPTHPGAAKASVHGPHGDITDVAAALAVIPNDGPADWDRWSRVGMAVWHATEGSDDGAEAFENWSSKNAAFDADTCAERWHHWTNVSPPTQIGAGSLYHMARAAAPGWEQPSRMSTGGLEFDAVPAGTASITIDARDPLGTARALISRQFTADRDRTLHRHRGEFWRWTGARYELLSTESIRARVYAFVDGAIGTDGQRCKPTARTVSDVVDATRAAGHLDDGLSPPAWVGSADGLPPADEIIAVQNGLLHTPCRALIPHTPQFFGTVALPYPFDAGALDPSAWLAFLGQVLPGDAEAINALQEMFGLLLTMDTSHQKIWLLIGPKRSGKGTIARVLKAMLGGENVVAPTLAGLATNFGVVPLIGKPAAIIGDARLTTHTNTGSLVERLLSISGQDAITVDRKNQAAWTGTLPTRFILLSNELPRLDDASGALASRFIVLRLGCSFYSREDHGLTDRLLLELPGILNWALAGLDRLRHRGRLVQPASGREALADLERLSSPVGAFVADCCTVGPDHSVPIDLVYEAYVRWVTEQGWRAASTKEMFGRDLRSIVSAVSVTRPRTGTRQRIYLGIGLADRGPGGPRGERNGPGEAPL